MDFLDTDGGHLPPGAAPPVPGNLLGGYADRPAGERAAFLAAITPRRFTVSAANRVSLLTEAVPGDTASVTGSDPLYLLTGAAPGTPGNWINLLTNTAAPSPP